MLRGTADEVAEHFYERIRGIAEAGPFLKVQPILAVMKLTVKERDGYRMLLLGPEGWTEQAAERYVLEGCDGIGLAPSPRGPIPDLEFLRPLTPLRSVVTGAAKVKDLSVLFEKSDLEELSLGLWVRDLRGIGRLTKLKHLAVPFRRGIDEVSLLTSLVSLSIEDWPKNADLEILGGPHLALRQLWLAMKRGAEINAEWFGNATSLEQLSFYFGCLFNEGGLAVLRGLRALRFASTKVGSIGFVRGMPGLHELELDDSGEIASLSPLRGHSVLKKLLITGSTRVADGDMNPLLEIPSLELVTVERSYSGYTHTYDQIRRLFPVK